MPITSFSVLNTRIINTVFCEQVPKVMIITGMNGVGKSTLLNELRKIDHSKVQGSGTVLYMGPHRVWRRKNINAAWLWDEEKEYANLLTKDQLKAITGIIIVESKRRYDNIDEAPTFIKYVLSQIELKRQNILVREIDNNNLNYPGGKAPDIYKPFKDLFSYLLPHLEFIGLNFEESSNIRCAIRVEGLEEPVDIDDLGSGEKEIIALFMPLIELRIYKILNTLTKNQRQSVQYLSDLVFVLDEPDLHIHPDTQKKMISYMQSTSRQEPVQFIMATHSPVIIGEAKAGELYELKGKWKVSPGENQLLKLN